MLEARLELAQGYPRKILSLVCLPISPLEPISGIMIFLRTRNVQVLGEQDMKKSEVPCTHSYMSIGNIRITQLS